MSTERVVVILKMHKMLDQIPFDCKALGRRTTVWAHSLCYFLATMPESLILSFEMAGDWKESIEVRIGITAFQARHCNHGLRTSDEHVMPFAVIISPNSNGSSNESRRIDS